MTFGKITGFFRDVHAAHRTAHEIERLSRLSNTDLAGLGLDRSEITAHAFRKHFNRI